MDPMIKNSFFTILIYWNDNRIHLRLTKKLIFFILFPPLLEGTKGAEVTQPDYQHLLDLEKLFVLHVLLFCIFSGQCGLHLQT